MEVLQPNLNLTDFFETVHAAPRRALLLDYDGTLAPFRVERDQALPYPGVRDILNAILRAAQTRLVIISGRVASELEPLLGLERRVEIWGTHGWERMMPDGQYSIAPLSPRLAQSLAKARAWIEERGLAHASEHKPASIAVHWRGLTPRAAKALRAEALACWSPLVQASGLSIHEFDGGLELRAPGRDKGFAVHTLCNELGAEAAIAFLGDDVTDEEGFRAVRPHGLGVLVRGEFRPTAAGLWLRPPAELLSFLAGWHAASSVR